MIDEKQLREEIEKEIAKIDLAHKTQSKDALRDLHRPAVIHEIEKGQTWIKKKYRKYQKFFANGYEIDPAKISPILVEVEETWQEDIFRLARYTWSLPYTKGYGRRLRYIILDLANNKLIGIFGLQSPPLDFPARDRLYNYPTGRKAELINRTLDVYTLGAIPPYNKLLGGKLVALAVTSNEVRDAYARKYGSHLTEMDKQSISPDLVCLTTTSAFGRSSIYNRLKYEGEIVAKSIGYTEGFGSFHLSTLYPQIRQYLEEKGISTRGGFGVGPRIVWQSFIRAKQQLGLPEGVLKHGVKREVFLFPLIKNLQEYMEFDASPLYLDRPFGSMAAFWKKRWLKSRAISSDGWHDWSNEEIMKSLIMDKNYV